MPGIGLKPRKIRTAADDAKLSFWFISSVRGSALSASALSIKRRCGGSRAPLQRIALSFTLRFAGTGTTDLSSLPGVSMTGNPTCRLRAMITLAKGNLLEAPAEALVNTVNCVGVMGKGIALQFKQAFPENFKAYKQACNRDEVEPGKMFVFDRGGLDLKTRRAALPHQLPHEAALEGEVEDGGHRKRPNGANRGDRAAEHPLSCHPTPGLW